MGLLETYNYYMTEAADPRTNDWLFVSSPVLITIITFAYLYFVLRCGPRYMKDRKPYSLKTFMQVYNLFQIVTNFKLIFDVLNAGWTPADWMYCIPYEFSDDPQSMTICKMVWYYLLIKIIDYIETGVFVLRKKQNQITFLHLYHHVSTVYITWLATKYYAGGSTMFFFMLNGGVHVIMYSYYFLAACGPMGQWIASPLKRYITLIQMVQFIVLIIYTLRNYLPYCRVSTFLADIILVDLVIIFTLFYNFYKTSYKKSKAR